MISTIETANNGIKQKIGYIRELFIFFNLNNLSIDQAYIDEFDEIVDDYEFGSLKILTKYYSLSNDYNMEKVSKDVFFKERKKYLDTYDMFLNSENICSKMDRVYNIIKYKLIVVDKHSHIRKDQYVYIRSLFTKYENIVFSVSIGYFPYTKCVGENCGGEMKLVPTKSTMVCSSCGIVERLHGTVFEDEQFYYQEGQRTKHGSYDPLERFSFWLDCIQAKENKDIPSDVISSIKECIRDNDISDVDDVTCEEIRSYLRMIKKTAYNEHAPLIRKLTTGVTPPQLTENELQVIYILISKIIRIYHEIKPEGKINLLNHTYFLYKIIEHLLKAKSETSRKRSILACIHLQSIETLIEDDNIWRDICIRIPEIEYVPTDRNNIP